MTKTLTFLGLLTAALIAGFVLTTGMGTNAFGGIGGSGDRAQIQEALEIGDYAYMSDEAQEKISPERFEKMLEKKSNHDAIIGAIEANSYDALPESAKEKIDADTFADKVQRQQEREADKAAMESVISSGDFGAFKAELESRKTDKEARMAEKFDGREKLKERFDNRSEPTEEQLRERFDELTTYYTENGELPDHKKGFGRHGKRGGGMHGYGKGGHCNDGASSDKLDTVSA